MATRVNNLVKAAHLPCPGAYIEDLITDADRELDVGESLQESVPTPKSPISLYLWVKQANECSLMFKHPWIHPK